MKNHTKTTPKVSRTTLSARLEKRRDTIITKLLLLTPDECELITLYLESAPDVQAKVRGMLGVRS